MNLSNLYEELLAGKEIVLTVAPESINTLYSQLRTVKSRYEKKYAALGGGSLSEGKVVRYESLADGSTKFFLGERKIRKGVEFQIISITEAEQPEIECQENTMQSGNK